MYTKLIVVVYVMLVATVSFAQSPQQMNYQAVVRNSSGQPIANGTAVKLRVTIHDGTATGTPVFSEVLTTTANQFGLVNVQIGSNNNLGIVDWGLGAKFLQVEADINNAGTYTDLGTSQLISVPYALYAANSNVGPQGPQGVTGPIGATGATGADGAQGPTGNTGTAGADGSTGSVGPTGATGTGVASVTDNGNGTATINLTNGAQFTIVLAAGPTGATGLQGATGQAGAQGVTGPTGPLIPGIIEAYGGTTAPAGWLLCDGQSFAVSQYPDLFNVIGTAYGGGGGAFNVPDLRGRFLRGVDAGAGNDPDNSTRSASNAGGNGGNNVGSLQQDAFQGHWHYLTYTTTGANGGPGNTVLNTSSQGGIMENQVLHPIDDGTSGAPRTSSESRPKNVYVNYIIKY